MLVLPLLKVEVEFPKLYHGNSRILFLPFLGKGFMWLPGFAQASSGLILSPALNGSCFLFFVLLFVFLDY